jgi:hypothetical protein
LEERKTNYMVLIVYKGGAGNQKFKQIKKYADDIADARHIAKQLSSRYFYSSAVVIDCKTNAPVEFWNAGTVSG